MVKNPCASAGDIRGVGSIPELGRCPGGGHGGNPSILAWRIPWTEEPGRLQPWVAKSRTRLKQPSTHASTHFHPRDGKVCAPAWANLGCLPGRSLSAPLPCSLTSLLGCSCFKAQGSKYRLSTAHSSLLPAETPQFPLQPFELQTPIRVCSRDRTPSPCP